MILLDTHVLLCTLAHPDHLGSRTRAAMREASGVYYSAVSIAEVTIKVMLGRLGTSEDLAAAAQRAGLQPLPLRPEHAAAIDAFAELFRHEPFDRLLLGQAYVERCRFLTVDGRLLDLDRIWIDDARHYLAVSLNPQVGPAWAHAQPRY